MPRAEKIEEGGEKRTKARKRWMKASLSAAGIVAAKFQTKSAHVYLIR